MEIFEKIIIPISLGVLAFVGAIFATGSFLIHPVFEIVVDGDEAKKSVIITNFGWVQAKNVRIYASPPEERQFFVNECAEMLVNEPLVLTLEMERMSSNLPCKFTVVTKGEPLQKITVTANDSPAYVWAQKTETTTVVDEIVWLYWGMIIALSTSISGTAFEYFERKRRKRL